MGTRQISDFYREYSNACTSRERGLEGRSRVCSRRAAAVLLKDHLEKLGDYPGKLNDFEVIEYFIAKSLIPNSKEILLGFTEQVDDSYSLASGKDLIKSLQQLAQLLNFEIKETPDAK